MEVCLLVSVVGVVLAAGVPAFMRTLEVSRIAEAPERLQRLLTGAIAYHDGMQDLGDGRRGIGCLPPAAGPTPSEPSAAGVVTDFASEETPGHVTWVALGFTPERPLRYRYSFVPAQDGCERPDPVPRPLVRVVAEGDLDSDGTLSRFERSAHLDGHSLRPDPMLRVVDRVE